MSSKRDDDLERELRADLELEEEEQRERGLSPEEAHFAALRAFGNPTTVREQIRETWWSTRIHSITRDALYSLRRLRRSPGFTTVVVLTLALGIGANTAIFTLVQQMLLRSLPVSDPSRLYRIGDRTHCCYFESFEGDDGDFDLFSYDLFKHFQSAAPEFDQLAAVQAGGGGFVVRWKNAPARPMRAEYVSGNYFSTLGVNTFAGRPLSSSDDLVGAAPVIVLSYATWQRDFGGSPGVIGSTVYLQKHAFTVAGIAPPSFYGDRISPFPPDLWLPLATEPLFEGANSALNAPQTAWLYAIGRLPQNIDRTALQAKLTGVLQQWMLTRPAFTERGGLKEIPKQHVVLSPAGGGIQKLQEQTGKGLRILMLLSTVVLLIACANIANLMLARSMAQRTELAVRVGLGATRARIIRQILTESLILSFLAGTVSLAVAYFGSRAILALAFPISQNMPMSPHPSPAVLLFAFLVSLFTGLLFALAPAWISSSAQPAEASRTINSSSRDHASLPQRLLLIFQIALSIVLLSSALLATRSLYNLEHQKTGIETANRYSVQLDLEGAGYTPSRLNSAYREIEDRFSALPGVARLSFARYLPLEGNEWGSCILVQGRPTPGPKDNCFADWNRVSTQFLASVGVPILRGRDFTQADQTSSLPVALVNQAFASQFFPGQDAIGQHFGVNGPEYAGAFQIVGVIGDFKLTDVRGLAKPLFLRPMGQEYAGYKTPELQAAETSSMYMNRMLIQFDRPQQGIEQLVRNTMAKIDPGIPIARVTPYDNILAGNFNQDRLLARLTEAFGLLALVLASVGLYGVMSYLAVRRTSEIGIRMALGASRSQIVSLMVRTAAIQVLAGLLIGVPASLFAGSLMTHLLYQVRGNDPFTFIASVALLGMCVAAAAAIPATRAASVDPIRALRTN